MKRFAFLFFIGAVIFSSCTLQSNSEYGSLVVLNQSELNKVVIESIYVREKNDSGYNLVWTGELQKYSSQFIELKPGAYSCKIRVKDSCSIFDRYYFYETGYGIYKHISASDFVNVVFDGNGIYFD